MNSLVHVAGWTLIHSLWQGNILALVYLAARAGLRNDGPHVRCGLACGVLFLMAAAAATTAGYEASSIGGSIAPLAVVVMLARALVATERTMPLLTLFWLAGAVLLVLRLAVAAASVRKLRRHASSAPNDWQRRVSRLMQQMGVRFPVHFLTHPKLAVPMVLGYLKPTILVSEGALRELTPQECEAILAHELAHIIRRDYLTNLLQTAIETVFFYHPAIWWMSSEIRKEREYCCDDAAAALSSDSLAYARVLLRVESLRGSRWQTTVASDGGHLKSRINRLVTPPARGKRRFTGLIIIGLFMTAIAIIITTQALRHSSTPPVGDDWLVAARTVAALNDVQDPRDSAAFLRALASQDALSREQGALALGVLGVPEAVGPLTSALDDRSYRVQHAAAQALIAVERPGERDRLKLALRDTVIHGMAEAVRDRNPAIRRQALEILSKP